MEARCPSDEGRREEQGPDELAPPSAAPPLPTPSASATRDLLANERTLLAWARTAVAVMGPGFVVARFGLAIRELAGCGAPAPPGLLIAFGVVLTLCGTLVLVLAYLRFRRVADDILHDRVRWDPRPSLLLTGRLLLAGLLLSAYLLLTG